MSNPSKIKGSTYEYKIRDILSKELKIDFQRVPLSGSLSYAKNDIWAPNNPEWNYVIECKHYKELDFNSLLTARSNDILQFWQQTLDGAKVMKKHPLLVFRWNRSKDFVAWNTNINLEYQINYKGFGYEFKIGELLKWLPQCKLQLK